MTTGIQFPLEGLRHTLEQHRDALAIVRLKDGATVGSVDVEPIGDELVIRAVCVDEDERGYGAGSEAVHLLMEALPEKFSSVRATAPADNGLAVYFWCRMGFAPEFGLGDGGSLRFVRRVP